MSAIISHPHAVLALVTIEYTGASPHTSCVWAQVCFHGPGVMGSHALRRRAAVLASTPGQGLQILLMHSAGPR